MQKFEVFVYSRNYKPHFDPSFCKKFKTTGEVETNYGLIRIYELDNVYLAILFTDGVVYDGLTVVKNKKRNGYYPVGYIDEVGNFELIETSKETLFRRLAYLKRYENKIKDRQYPAKTNTDPLETKDYWHSRELFYNKAGTEPKRLLTVKLENGKYWKKGIVDVFMINREGRDNKDFIVAYDYAEPEKDRTKDKIFEVYGKLGETYILKPYAIKHLCDEKEAVRLIKVIKEDYEKISFEVLDKEGYELLDKLNNLCYNNNL
jgi:hypothetical protein